MSEESELRLAVAAHHALGADAAALLVGSTVEELEESATALAKLVGKSNEPDPEVDAPTDLFAGAAARKAERQQAILGALTGRSPQERDAQGRFVATSSTGFDGGARELVPVRRSPEAEHNELVAQMAAISRTYRG